MLKDSHVDSGQPAVTVFDLTEPTAVNEGMELADQDAMQLQPMPLRARRVVVRLDAAIVVFHSTNRRLRTSTRLHAGLLAYVVFGPQSNGTVNGLPVRPGLMLAAEPETEARFVVEEGWETVSFLMAPADVQAHLEARGRGHQFRLPHGIETLQAEPDGARRLFDWSKRLTTTAARQPFIFNDRPRERAAAQVELLETLLPVLGVAEQLEPTRSDRTRRAHSDTVAIAEAHAMSHVDDPLSVTDLCRATGVSERTLDTRSGPSWG